MDITPVLLYQHKKLLNLSPNACKILIFIATSISERQLTITIYPQDVNLYPLNFDIAIDELIANEIITNVKLSDHKYWINITVVTK